MRIGILTRQLDSSSPVVVANTIDEPTIDEQHAIAAMNGGHYNEDIAFIAMLLGDIIEYCDARPAYYKANWQLTLLDRWIVMADQEPVVLTINPHYLQRPVPDRNDYPGIVQLLTKL